MGTVIKYFVNIHLFSKIKEDKVWMSLSIFGAFLITTFENYTLYLEMFASQYVLQPFNYVHRSSLIL